MANLDTAMDSAFWDLSIASPQTLLEGSAKYVPGRPIPLDGTRGSRALRIQQLSLLGNGFPLGIIPSFNPTPQKELGSFSIQSLLFKQEFADWWVGLVGQFRPKKLFSKIKSEFASTDEWELPAFKDAARHILDKSLYSLGLCSQIALTSSTSVLLSSEAQGERKGRRNRAMLFHKLPNHDITMEAGWPELYIDHDGKYWEVPESISLDCSSLVSDSGLRYRFGLHKNTGHPQAVDSNGEVPLALLPGLCAKAAVSIENSKDLWRVRETKEDLIIETPRGRFRRPAYDIRLKEPHAAVSAIIGGMCEAWVGGKESSPAVELGEGVGESVSLGSKKRSPFSADLFGSFCYTVQHGKFRKYYGDLTRLDARLDISSASALAEKVVNIFKSTSSVSNADTVSAAPRLNLIFQQQVAGPITFRVDSKFLLDAKSGRPGVHVEDLMYSLNYSLRLLQSGKVVAWYSPKRKEAMIELRLFEF